MATIWPIPATSEAMDHSRMSGRVARSPPSRIRVAGYTAPILLVIVCGQLAGSALAAVRRASDGSAAPAKCAAKSGILLGDRLR